MLQYPKKNDISSKFKVMVIKASIQAVATYGGKLFGMSGTRCRPIQQVVDVATQTFAKCGKSAAMVRPRQELSLTDLNIKTALARTRALGKLSQVATKPPLLPTLISMRLVGKLLWNFYP
ncbi:hypothetical protein BB561_000233 [Smittium simulii]|uniref:Uncharacterized protein n=1 Tax=Smittium simulii TaxID=133385 RepID=A0A2T9YZV8_9FUNG|nr:hypothetical protein BB561_000233 [Smittium simulii]